MPSASWQKQGYPGEKSATGAVRDNLNYVHAVGLESEAPANHFAIGLQASLSGFSDCGSIPYSLSKKLMAMAA